MGLDGSPAVVLPGDTDLHVRRHETAAGPGFSLPAFHAAVLDHGSLPMPALTRSITGRLDRADRMSSDAGPATGRDFTA